jgi:protein TonB
MPFAWNGNPLSGAPAQPRRQARNPGSIDFAMSPALRNSRGAPPRSTHSNDAMIRVEGAQVGDDWINQLHEWWDEHAYYPPEAAKRNESGNLVVHLVVGRDGVVQSVRLDSPSGSQWLDLGAQALFRGAHLPPFPQSTPESKADIILNLEYDIVRP